MTITDQVGSATRVREATPREGGLPARRAVVRWARRMVRREWRAQALVFTLLMLAVAAAIGGATAAYNLTPAGAEADFGSATHWLQFDEPDPAALPGDIAAAEEWFGSVDVIARRFVAVPGVFEPVEFRAQEPESTYGAPMLALVTGAFPASAGEVALTDATAQALSVDVGDSFELASDRWTVVGAVENPSDLGDEFALVSPSADQVATSRGDGADVVTMLIGGSDERFESFRPPSHAAAVGASRSENEDVLAATGVLVAGALVLMLVGLIAAAGFAVVARRRLRQLGMLAAIGATQRHLRLVMVANGAVVGLLAALSGAAVALLAWLVVSTRLEAAVGHRIATFDVPWWLIGTGMLLALVSATGAAWWPARAIARTSIVSAISGRPDRPQSAKRSAALAVVLVAAGVALLAVAGDPVESMTNAALVLAGIVALVVGVLFLSPLAIRALARLRGSAPVAVRLALTDLVRYQARAGSALAAISLALGIATVIVATASSAMYNAASEGNLSDRQLMIRIGEIPGDGDIASIDEKTPAELERLELSVAAFAETLRASVTDIDVAVAYGQGFDEYPGLPAVVLGTPVETDGKGTTYRSVSHVYIGSSALLELYGLDEGAVDANADVLTVETDELWFVPMRDEPVRDRQELVRGYTSLPGSFITPEAMELQDWTPGRAGWLLDASAPITAEQLADARAIAATSGVTVEARDDQRNLAALRAGAAGVGAMVALAIMAMTVGLVRSEAAGDLRILTASGATSGNRRTLTAATAGALAVLGAILGMSGAYLGLGAAHLGGLDALTPVPVFYLALIGVGLPVVAAVGGWLLAGREPHWLARQPLD